MGTSTPETKVRLSAAFHRNPGMDIWDIFGMHRFSGPQKSIKYLKSLVTPTGLEPVFSP